MSAPNMIEVVTIVLRDRGHEGVPQSTIEALARSAEGLPANQAIYALEDAIEDYERTHPVSPEWTRREREERIAAHDANQRGHRKAAERRAARRSQA